MDEKDVYKELSSIRELMERSSKFISLSGLSGVLAGIYALAGAAFAFRIIDWASTDPDPNEQGILWPLIIIALTVLVLSILTSYWLSLRKAKSRNENIWNPVSKRLLAAVSFPMFTGGLFIAIMILKGEYTLVAPASLIFYGLALIAGSQYTFSEIKWLGICEILLGLLSLSLSHNSLLLWPVGFGLLHILYGTIMHFKYER